MKALKNIQEIFQTALLSQNNALDCIVSTRNVSAQTRLGIYIHAYFARLAEALTSNYPILFYWLGEKKFNQLALKYIKKFPSQFSSIRWFGDYFAEFLESEGELPAYAEMAKFEWCMQNAFDAKNAKTLSFKKMNKISAELWPGVFFKIHPTVRRLNLRWNVVAIWQAITDEKNIPKLKKHSMDVPWIVWRKSLINQFYSLSPEEAWSFDALSKGKTFGTICAGLCAWMDEEQVGLQAAVFLRTWIGAGLISEVRHVNTTK